MKRLNFGCGSNIREGWDNVDRQDFDFNEFPYPIKMLINPDGRMNEHSGKFAGMKIVEARKIQNS